MIPKIIHQSWKTKTLGTIEEQYANTWKTLHPQYEYWLHTDEDNLELVTNYYPQWLALYLGYKFDIQRADLARYMYMHQYGGIYADLDLECLRPIDDLLVGRSAVLVKEPDENFVCISNLIANYFLASVRGSNFFFEVLKSILIDSRKDYTRNKFADVLLSTGPVRLMNVYADCSLQRIELPYIFDSSIFTPFTHKEILNNRDGLDGLHQRVSKSAYGIHHFHGSWH